MPIKQEILHSLTRNARNLSTLDLSNQQLTVADIKTLLTALVFNTHLVRLNLANNLFGDEGASLLASQLRVSELNVSYNHISDEGIKAFVKNNDLDAINIQGNTFTFITRKRLDQKIAANFQAKISKLAIILSVIAQGRGQIASPLTLLPTELIFSIISYLGTSWCSDSTLNKMATIIFNNINYDSNYQKIFLWNRPTEKPFKVPSFFSIAKTYTPHLIEGPDLEAQKEHKR
ncbi:MULTISPECIES: hypothetical protein [Legionella]|uniref:Gala protein type 1, 3 or 4 n=1 Tax=Legionella resiliens TaxID=2905958 RepID=A0ABS8X6R4_9GAMM|nr:MULTISPECIES: hypothetical protein [unclassified Legionella]MCE0723630.1 hypothetical protein [Legionella sp. 9fVS26]MCE3532783.1 hypothetical protein [Legionella sp. 8cVS16]QLZ68919.1 hypothetical protein FOLKNPGA_01699 [Legionella sp. PC1000]